jgi:hypothetical protein
LRSLTEIFVGSSFFTAVADGITNGSAVVIGYVLAN